MPIDASFALARSESLTLKIALDAPRGRACSVSSASAFTPASTPKSKTTPRRWWAVSTATGALSPAFGLRDCSERLFLRALPRRTARRRALTRAVDAPDRCAARRWKSPTCALRGYGMLAQLLPLLPPALIEPRISLPGVHRNRSARVFFRTQGPAARHARRRPHRSDTARQCRRAGGATTRRVRACWPAIWRGASLLDAARQRDADRSPEPMRCELLRRLSRARRQSRAERRRTDWTYAGPRTRSAGVDRASARVRARDASRIACRTAATGSRSISRC